MEVEDSFLRDGLMADEVERMPGGAGVTYQGIRNFREHKDFMIFDDNGSAILIEYDENIKSAFNYYFELWDNCHEFGLPNGGDWTKSPSWLLSLVKMFNSANIELQNYRTAKRQR